VLLTYKRYRLRDPIIWAILTLLLSCLAGIPTPIECRYLLPLHLLLLTIVAFCVSPKQYLAALRGRPAVAIVAVVIAGLWLGGCFWLSAATFRNLQPDRGKSLVDD
jgi:hypothetical protein